MTLEIIRDALGWCTLINFALLLWWFLFFTFAHDWTFRMHSRWYNIALDRFDTLHYAGITIFKLAILFFNLVPYLSLRIVI